jgi:hypothetical protein
VDEIRNILDFMKAKEYCLIEAENHWNRAKTKLSEIEMSNDSRESILASGEFLLGRIR